MQKLSLAIPLYDEEEVVRRVAEDLLRAFDGENLELLLVDNGSSDRTGEIIAELARSDARVRGLRVPVNRGYGLGVRTGLEAATGDWIGWMGGDGQIDPADVRRVWDRARQNDADLVKVLRVQRNDGLERAVISRGYNLLFELMFEAGSKDINGTPKLFRRELLRDLPLTADDWWLDAEVMIGARRRQAKVVEVPVEFLTRAGGASKVRYRTVAEFLWNMLRAARS